MKQTGSGSPVQRGTESHSAGGLLGDTSGRDYTAKLRVFNAFAARELRQAVAGLGLRSGMSVMDAGCGTGDTLQWLDEAVGPTGLVMGIDLASAHVRAARTRVRPDIPILQCDLERPCLKASSFDLVWSANTINHLRDPVAGITTLSGLLRPGGRLSIAQSSLLPDMFFAWDARLERVTNDAVRQYYRDRYGLTERDLAGVRSLVGNLKRGSLKDVTVSTYVIERVAPLSPPDHAYFADTIFRDTWGSRLEPYLSRTDYEELSRLCDPRHPEFALNRPDFHFLQTFTVATGAA